MSSKESWDLEIDPYFFKELKRIPKDYAEQILHGVRDLCNNPFAGDIQKMKGEKNTWRRRVGAFRVFHVERRTSKTY